LSLFCFLGKEHANKKASEKSEASGAVTQENTGLRKAVFARFVAKF